MDWVGLEDFGRESGKGEQEQEIRFVVEKN